MEGEMKAVVRVFYSFSPLSFILSVLLCPVVILSVSCSSEQIMVCPLCLHKVHIPWRLLTLPSYLQGNGFLSYHLECFVSG